jgi:hypothetical protein
MFHLHPEYQFLGGKPYSRGPTHRRHIRVTSIRLIGKEANEWERQAILGFDDEAELEYGLADGDVTQIVRDVATVADGLGKVVAAKALKITLARLNTILADREIVDPGDAQALAEHLPSALQRYERNLNTQALERTAARELVAKLGWRGAARDLGVDAANLRRKIAKDFR